MKNPIYIAEAVVKSKKKKYKCPYCDVRLDRGELISHINEEHKDMIPEKYTAARLVFNIVNKKDHGNCVICTKETPWNEEVYRYERYCIDNNNRCLNKASEIAKNNMVKVYGKEHLLNNDEHQKLMLAHRAISGTYKFSHGGELSYTGSYEKKLLEFFDKVMNYRSIDIMSPGPSIEYIYKGESHTWITDQYLIPFNLVFDVKDGGDNPNNREMPEFREKQIAKEAAIKKLGTYNYIRLTDNNFAQLILILAELKEQMMDLTEDKEPIIRINENTEIKIDDNFSEWYNNTTDEYKSYDEYTLATIGSMVGIDNKNPIFIIPYMQKNSFTIEYAISNNRILDNIFVTDEFGEIVMKDNKFLEEQCEVFSVFKFIKPDKQIPNNIQPSNLVETITGKKILDPNQLLYDKDFEQVISFKDVLTMAQDSFIASLKGTKYEIPVVGVSYTTDSNLEYYQDQNGYFIKNNQTNLRSKSFKAIKEISNELINYISIGKL